MSRRHHCPPPNPYVEWLKSLGCVFYAPLVENDTSDWISGQYPTTDTGCTVTWDANQGMYNLYSRRNGQNYGALNWRSGLNLSFSNGDAGSALITVKEIAMSGNGYNAMITSPNLYGRNTSNENLIWICQARYQSGTNTGLHKYAITYPQNDGLSPVGIKFYRDGTLIRTANWTLQTCVGYNTVGVCQANINNTYYQIYAKDAMVFNRVLTQSEIQMIQA